VISEIELSQAETDDDRQLAKESSVFHFQIKDDMDIFLKCLESQNLLHVYGDLIYFSFQLKCLYL